MPPADGVTPVPRCGASGSASDRAVLGHRRRDLTDLGEVGTPTRAAAVNRRTTRYASSRSRTKFRTPSIITATGRVKSSHAPASRSIASESCAPAPGTPGHGERRRRCAGTSRRCDHRPPDPRGSCPCRRASSSIPARSAPRRYPTDPHSQRHPSVGTAARITPNAASVASRFRPRHRSATASPCTVRPMRPPTRCPRAPRS
jgi:hypothetical protein